MVVWESDASAGSDTSSTSIQMQRLDADGSPIGGEVQVNDFTLGSQLHPSVHIDSAGRSIVTWVSTRSATPSNDIVIHARRYAADGAPIEESFQVSTELAVVEDRPKVASDREGNLVVVWEDCDCLLSASLAPALGQESDRRMLARRFDSTTAPLGPPFSVNSYTTGAQLHGDVVMNANGEFVVTWMSFGSFGTDSHSSSIQVRRFDSNGVPGGDELQVNTYTTESQTSPVAARDAEGRLIVAWTNFVSGTPEAPPGIRVRRFDAAGEPLGDEFQVNVRTSGRQSRVAVAAGEVGFLVLWESLGSSSADDSEWGIQGRYFGADGVPLGGDFQINSFTTGNQVGPAVAMDDSGNILAVWSDTETDGDRAGIRARLFRPVFLDGFESGSTQRWSRVVAPSSGEGQVAFGDSQQQSPVPGRED
ncbi:MAG: hypothetical protein AMXMBFR36_15330 [Acidobacteriota bacterium]